MAITFRSLPKGSTIGSGSYIFRHYGDEAPAELPYLCFTAEQANSTVEMSVRGTPTKGQAFETSTDGINWSIFTPGTTTITLANIGDKVYFRGDNTTVSESTSIYYKFVMSGKIAASGNIMSLLDKTCQSTTISNNYCYCYMFNGCTSLTTAPTLLAATLAINCYRGMFIGCTSLTTAPALPAATLASSCYRDMFQDCTSLQVYPSSGTGHTKAWRIPTSGDASSYTSQSDMFIGCHGPYSSTSSVLLNTTFYTQNTPV